MPGDGLGDTSDGRCAGATAVTGCPSLLRVTLGPGDEFDLQTFPEERRNDPLNRRERHFSDYLDLLMRSESRWPRYERASIYPCDEHLYVRRHAT